MTKSQTIQVRVRPEAKLQAEEVLSTLGVSMSEAVNMFLHQVILRRGMPFDVVIPKAPSNIEVISGKVKEICQQYKVKRLALFGSQARGEARPSGDYDFRLDKGALRGLDFFAFKHDLEKALDSKVDLVTTESMDEEFASQIAREEVIVYESR